MLGCTDIEHGWANEIRNDWRLPRELRRRRVRLSWRWSKLRRWPGHFLVQVFCLSRSRNRLSSLSSRCLWRVFGELQMWSKSSWSKTTKKLWWNFPHNHSGPNRSHSKLKPSARKSLCSVLVKTPRKFCSSWHNHGKSKTSFKYSLFSDCLLSSSFLVILLFNKLIHLMIDRIKKSRL